MSIACQPLERTLCARLVFLLAKREFDLKRWRNCELIVYQVFYGNIRCTQILGTNGRMRSQCVPGPFSRIGRGLGTRLVRCLPDPFSTISNEQDEQHKYWAVLDSFFWRCRPSSGCVHRREQIKRRTHTSLGVVMSNKRTRTIKTMVIFTARSRCVHSMHS